VRVGVMLLGRSTALEVVTVQYILHYVRSSLHYVASIGHVKPALCTRFQTF